MNQKSIVCWILLLCSPFGLAHGNTDEAVIEEITAKLQPAEKLQAAFLEIRHSPARRTPGHFSGTLRWSIEHGLSLEYTRPRSQTVVMTHDGTFRSTGDGALRPMPRSDESDLWNKIMFDLFLLRIDEWEESFDIRATLAEDGVWSIQLRPKADSEFAGLLHTVEIHGTDDVLNRIRFRRDLRRVIEIQLSEIVREPTWCEEEVATAFPQTLGQ